MNDDTQPMQTEDDDPESSLLAIRDTLCDLQSAYRFVGEALVHLLKAQEAGYPAEIADGAAVVLDALHSRDATLLAQLDEIITVTQVQR